MIDSLVCAMKENERFERYAVQVALLREPGAHDRPRLDQPSAVYRVFKALSRLDRECVAVALLDSQLRLNAVHAVHIGTQSQAPVGVPDVFKAAILANAGGIVLVHNHPSGEMAPSDDDIALTRQIREVGDIIGIPLLDHVIIAGDDYISLHDTMNL